MASYLGLFPVVPRLFHRADGRSPCIPIPFPLFPVFRVRKKGIQEIALMARAAETGNAENTMKPLVWNREQTGNRSGNTGNIYSSLLRYLHSSRAPALSR